MRSLFRSRLRRARRVGPGLGCRLPCRLVPRRRSGLPRSWGTPVLMPCSRTPAGPLGQSSLPLGCCLPSTKQRRLPRCKPFRGSITRPVHSLSTLRRVDCSTSTQDSLPAADSALPGGLHDLSCPAGFLYKVSVHLFLLVQAFVAQLASVSGDGVNKVTFPPGDDRWKPGAGKSLC